MPSIEPIRVDGLLTSEEYELTRWILEQGKPEALQFIEQLDRARVGRLPLRLRVSKPIPLGYARITSGHRCIRQSVFLA